MDQTFMKEKKILPLVLSMALPMIISMAVNSLYNIIDSFFVAKVSENAMTALSLVYPIQNLVNSIAVGFGVGINAVVAFHLGAGEMQNADRATTYGLFLSFIHGLILTVFSIFGMPYFVKMFTTDTDVINLAVMYSTIVFSFSTIVNVGIAFEKIFQAVGRMNVSMISMICGCVTNIILDPLMIFGLGPFPAMGSHRYRTDYNAYHLLHILLCKSYSGKIQNKSAQIRQTTSEKAILNRCTGYA